MEKTKHRVSSKQQNSFLHKIRMLGLDAIQLVKNEHGDMWQEVRGILPKKPSAIIHQRSIRKEWV